jgi:hypothetical protein
MSNHNPPYVTVYDGSNSSTLRSSLKCLAVGPERIVTIAQKAER